VSATFAAMLVALGVTVMPVGVSLLTVTVAVALASAKFASPL
jgi:hypothetical protein